MPVDLWGPTNQGLQNLNQAFTNKMTWDRQDRTVNFRGYRRKKLERNLAK
jgi:hypothetical protein